MSKQVAFIHTSASMIPLFKPLAGELLPTGTNVFNLVDESLLCNMVGSVACPPATTLAA